MRKNIVLNFRNEPKKEFGEYAQAYQRAAKKLFDLFSEYPDFVYNDLDGLPIVFLYRHAVELYLKSIVLRLNTILAIIFYIDKKSNFKSNEKIATHDLECLRKTIVDLIEDNKNSNDDLIEIKNEFSSSKTSETIDLLNKIIELDNSSFTFRYPTKRDLTACLEKHTIINLLDLGNSLEELCNKLTAMDWFLEAQYSKLCDFLEALE